MRHLARIFVSSLILLPGLARAQMPGSSDLDQFLAQLGLTGPRAQAPDFSHGVSEWMALSHLFLHARHRVRIICMIPCMPEYRI